MSEANNQNTAFRPAASPLLLALAFVLSFGLVFLVLRGGWSLGFFLAVLLTELIFIGWQQLAVSSGSETKPAGSSAGWPVQIVLALLIINLGFCLFLYDDIVIKIFNVLVIFALLPLQYLLASGVFLQDWDKPDFWLEAAVSYVVRPFSGLAGFGREVVQLFQRPLPTGSTKTADRRSLGTVAKIIIGLLLAIPVLLISGSLLASADQVFADLTSQLLTNLSLNEFLTQLFLALILLPFIFSFLYSGRTRQRFVDQDGSLFNRLGSSTKGFRIDKIILITFLTCINLLYILFAAIQVTYLTGAFQAILPDNLTYAEYARSGFFELAGVTFINLILVLIAIKGADRSGAAGKIVRFESLLLVAGSLVQWASAMFRMKMYIDAYGLSLQRFWVTAFMLLQLVVFLLMLIKEFQVRFPLFKFITAAVLLSLLMLNHVNSDAWIARHNVDRYQATGRIDTSFFNELSSSAVPAMLELTKADDPAVAREIARQLVSRLEPLADKENFRWQKLNLAQIQAKEMINDQLDSLNGLLLSEAVELVRP